MTRIRLPHHATVVSYIALVMAVGTGGAYAANTISSADVIDDTLTSADVRLNSLVGSDIASNSITGTDVAESSLRLSELGCQRGMVRGFAHVNGSAGIPTFFTNASDAIDTTNNCADGAVEVRRVKRGTFVVRFRDNPAALATAVSNLEGDDIPGFGFVRVGRTVGVRKIVSGADAGGFEVRLSGSDGLVDGAFTIMLL